MNNSLLNLSPESMNTYAFIYRIEGHCGKLHQPTLRNCTKFTFKLIICWLNSDVSCAIVFSFLFDI